MACKLLQKSRQKLGILFSGVALERQMRDYSPIHPGEILQEEFLVPMGINQERLARDIGVPASLISEIVRGESGISADTALRLARYFGMSVEFWTGIQTHYEIEKAKVLLADRLEKEVKVFESA